MQQYKFQYLLIILILVSFFSCKDDDAGYSTIYSDIYTLPFTPFNYSNVNFPSTFNSYVMGLDNTPIDNPITDDGATLGRVLFYDKNMSFNNTISCASCHFQEFGFADPSTRSMGFGGEHTRRNSMNIVNSGFYEPKNFFWDHRAETLEQQVLMPLQDGIEMGMTLDLVVERVSSKDYYKPLFKNAFSSEEVTSDKISKALAQFVRSIYSFNTKYDAGIEATQNIFVDFPNFTAQENLGKDVFNGKLTPNANGTCVFCHMTNANLRHDIPFNANDVNQVIFTSSRTDNIGLDEDDRLPGVDNGLGEISGITHENGEFKTPSIRNIELTSPYMHDGRFQTLEEVVEHYSTGIKDHPYLSDHMINGDQTPRNLNLSEAEKAALVAFLKTLTDETLTTDAKYSNPFVN
ncbi:MAG: cytochrome c peroxidase [Flavobacteriaceae bacterium]